MTIKHKSGWYVNSKPFMRQAPIKPEKMLRLFNRKTLVTITAYDGDDFLLSNLFPEKANSELKVSIKMEDFDRSMAISVYVDEITEAPNPHYEKQIVQYEEACKKYKKDKLGFKKELEDWALWKKQEEQKAAEKELEWAQKILKKHGKA